MPWHTEKGGGSCSGDQWAVIKDDDGSTAGCHDSEDAAKNQMAALYASERGVMSVSEVRVAENRGMSKRDRLRDAPERRAIAVSEFELRDVGGNVEFTGYASMFDTRYEVFGGPPLGWHETVDRRAFDVTLAEKPDLHLLINHEGLPLARTKSSTMRLSTDTRGLHVAANLDRRDPDVQKLQIKMDRRDIDEMSMAFRTKNDDWNDAETERRLLEVSLHRGDVSIVNFGANTASKGQLRSTLSFLENLDVEVGLAELRSVEAGISIEQLTTARNMISRFIREATPEQRRPLSLKDALAVAEGRR